MIRYNVLVYEQGFEELLFAVVIIVCSVMCLVMRSDEEDRVAWLAENPNGVIL